MSGVKKSEYMLILRDTDWDRNLDAGEIEKTIAEYNAWFGELLCQGKIKDGKPLRAGGRMVAKRAGRVSDGPFIESKEAIGGFILVEAAGYEEAVGLAKTFPPVARGVVVEIRELAEVCPVSQRLKERTVSAAGA